MRRFSEHELNQRTVQIETTLEDFGDFSVTDEGRNGPHRRLRFELTAPGYDLDPIAYFKYEDTFVRDGRTWVLLKYRYDYIDRKRDSRLAYHMHDIGGRQAVFHAHCGPAEEEEPDHYRAYEWTVFEAHDDFVRLLAADRPVDCSGMRSLDPA